MAYDKPNYTQAPNGFFDQHLPDIKSMAELKVTLLVLRGTFGWHEKEVDLTIAAMMAAGGMARQTVLDGVRLALDRGTIRRRKSGRSFAYEANILSVQNPDRSKRSESADVRPLSVGNSDRSRDPSLDRLKKGNKQVVPTRKEDELKPPYQGRAFLQALEKFETVQTELKKPLRHTRREMIYDKLQVWGEAGATESLLASASAAYPDVYEPNTNRLSRSNGNGHHSTSGHPKFLAGQKSKAEMEEQHRVGAEYAENIKRIEANRAK